MSELFEYENTNENQVSLTKYIGEDAYVEVPDEIHGKRVVEIGDYAFAGQEIKQLILGDAIRRIGRYALYNCSELAQLSFTDSLTDIGAGAFTGCHRIKNIQVTFRQGEESCLREVLMEVAEELQVDYYAKGEHARLMFPEFYEEGVENTPARIIESHTHGSGLHYRHCFYHNQFQFQEYDKMFSKALSQESLPFNVKLALGRLRYPLALSGEAADKYQKYLLNIFDKAIEYLRKTNQLEEISFLMNMKNESGSLQPLSFDL